MLNQLIIGSMVISLSVIIEVLFIYLAVDFMRSRAPKQTVTSLFTMMLYLIGITLWMLLAFSIVTWCWALTLLTIGAMPNLEESLYFSMVAFTSLGFGDLVLDDDWRLLSGMMAANGLLIFGLNTAIIVETLRGVLNSYNESQSTEKST